VPGQKKRTHFIFNDGASLLSIVKSNKVSDRETPAPASSLAYSAKEVARLLGISETTVHEEWSQGRGPKSFRIGRRRLVSDSALREWIFNLEAKELETA
jgi:excisionase family DNA binding protein